MKWQNTDLSRNGIGQNLKLWVKAIDDGIHHQTCTNSAIRLNCNYAGIWRRFLGQHAEQTGERPNIQDASGFFRNFYQAATLADS